MQAKAREDIAAGKHGFKAALEAKKEKQKNDAGKKGKKGGGKGSWGKGCQGQCYRCGQIGHKAWECGSVEASTSAPAASPQGQAVTGVRTMKNRRAPMKVDIGNRFAMLEDQEDGTEFPALKASKVLAASPQGQAVRNEDKGGKNMPPPPALYARMPAQRKKRRKACAANASSSCAARGAAAV